MTAQVTNDAHVMRIGHYAAAIAQARQHTHRERADVEFEVAPAESLLSAAGAFVMLASQEANFGNAVSRSPRMNRIAARVFGLGLAFLVQLVATADLGAQEMRHGEPAASPYAGQETRAIKSLSEEDLAELRRGGGWGLAKVAELNGVPGPAHLLELKDQIPLTGDQVEAFKAIFQDMRSRAIAEGERLIARERALEDAFRARTIDGTMLRRLLAAIETSRSELRYIHLAAHLEALPRLTEAQIARYQTLRGYGVDPCANVPAGHDSVMWRRHHGCK